MGFGVSVGHTSVKYNDYEARCTDGDLFIDHAIGRVRVVSDRGMRRRFYTASARAEQPRPRVRHGS